MRAAAPIDFDCQTCGACCANSRPNRDEKYRDYVQITGQDKLARRPDLLRTLTILNDHGETHLKLVGREQRCVALQGKLGERVACTIYELRPRPCRIVEAGSRECLARRRERRIGC
jgi:Fe-S-cluster containining protein